LVTFTMSMSMAAVGRAESVFTVKPLIIEQQKSVYATVQATDTTAARVRIAGTVVELDVDEGDTVTAGQVIARVRDSKLELELRAVDQRIQALASRVRLADVELKRARTLAKKGTISQARLDQAETAVTVLRRDLSAMRAERAVIVEREAEGRVMAPAAGRVLRVEVTSGKAVLAGETIATITADAYILRLELPERHARFIKQGDTVNLGRRDDRDDKATAAPGRIAGTVRQVYPEIRGGRVVADVEVAGLGDFFVGERVGILISVGQRRGFVVPQKYLVHRFGLTFVALEDAGEIVVQPGQPTPDGIEILSGLRAGDRLLLPAMSAKP
jgi:RND family efflux transporter MFP subunit